MAEDLNLGHTKNKPSKRPARDSNREPSDASPTRWPHGHAPSFKPFLMNPTIKWTLSSLATVFLYRVPIVNPRTIDLQKVSRLLKSYKISFVVCSTCRWGLAPIERRLHKRIWNLNNKSNKRWLEDHFGYTETNNTKYQKYLIYPLIPKHAPFDKNFPTPSPFVC